MFNTFQHTSLVCPWLNFCIFYCCCQFSHSVWIFYILVHVVFSKTKFEFAQTWMLFCFVLVFFTNCSATTSSTALSNAGERAWLFTLRESAWPSAMENSPASGASLHAQKVLCSPSVSAMQDSGSHQVEWSGLHGSLLSLWWKSAYHIGIVYSPRHRIQSAQFCW